MANVYCDQDLATGSNNGTDWANAYLTLSAAIAAAAAGDIIYVQSNLSTSGADINLNASNSTEDNPIIVLGCVEGTTNEPPVQSDLNPGWRTGEARTEANLAYNDAGIPSLTISGTGDDLSFGGFMYIYGIALSSGRTMGIINNVDSDILFEECLFDVSTAVSQTFGAPNATNLSAYRLRMKNCHLDLNGVGIHSGRGATIVMIGGKITGPAAKTICDAGNGTFHFIGVDLSDQAHTLADAGDDFDLAKFQNCKLNGSSAIVSGTPTTPYRIEVHQCSNVTGKASGTIVNYDLASDAGTITEETTAVRTGGANDGTSNYSLAFTPIANATRDQYKGLIGPWIGFEIGAADSQVDIHIANSGASDYNNDDVYLELMYPSEGGTAQFSNQTTQMELLDTPAAVTDDTGSTWGTGANNHQILRASIDPDYDGLAYYRVVFPKNFTSSPETLYVDPKPVVS